jgi:GNAT superfamily N-acetyltransferase
LFSYAGQRAANADKSALARAVEMEQQGIDNETIRKETNWFLNPMDKMWRFEINDSEIELTSPFKSENNKTVPFNQEGNWYDARLNFSQSVGKRATKLNDILEDNKLFDAYPELKNITVGVDIGNNENGGAYYDPDRKFIGISKNTDVSKLKNVLLHEIQHATQDIEGFAMGGSTSYAVLESDKIKNKIADLKKSQEYIKAHKYIDEVFEKENKGEISEKERANVLNDVNDKFPVLKEIGALNRNLIKFANDKQGVTGYLSLAGEIEARDTQARMGMTAAQRRESTPYVSQGIAKEDAIVRFGSGIAESRTNNIDIKQKNDFLYSESEYGLVGGHIRDGALYIDYSEVDENQRGKGYGKQLYLALIDNALNKDLKVFSGSTVEQGAVNVYKSLVKNGYEVIDSRTGTLEDGSAYGKGAESPVFEVKKELAANLTQLFADLDQYKKGNLKNRIKAVQSLKDNPNKARIMFIDKNIIDLIGKLEKAGVEVNCK